MNAVLDLNDLIGNGFAMREDVITGAPTMRLAAALVNSTREQDSAIGAMIAVVMNAANCDERIDALVGEFKEEYAQLQVDPESKSAKQVRASRSSDLKAVLKAAVQFGDYQAQAQALIDSGKGGLQGLAKLARSMGKTAKDETKAEAEADDNSEVNEAGLSLVEALSAALSAARKDGRHDIASMVEVALSKL